MASPLPKKGENFNWARYNVIVAFILIIGLVWLSQVRAQPQNKELMQQISKINMNFAFKLYQLMADQHDIILSPFLINIALTMTSFGAGSETLRQLYEALDLNGFADRADVAAGYSAILRSLEVNGDTSIVVLNKMSASKESNVKKTFSDVITEAFGTEFVPFNILFDHPLAAAIDENDPCTQQTTKFNFTTMLSFGNGANLSTEAAEEPPVGLMSTVFFKGKWTQPFCQENTYPEEFRLENLSNHSQPTMHSRGDFYYGEDEEVLDSKMLRLDYTGSRMVMYVILPNTLGGFERLKKNLNAEIFENFRNNMRLEKVAVSLPIYTGHRMQNLSPDLKNLSIFDLEDEMRADLNEMAEPQPSGASLRLKQVLYTAHVELGEYAGGAEPNDQHLANTGFVHDGRVASHFISHVGRRQSPGETKEFRANHPFVFIIYDTLTDLILFIGNLDNFAKVSYRV